ncbi:hypothetical protein ASPWEDRAFT_738670 [Aspergillus wentii DTO 134E9]|uniref:Metallo-beta-lactamase domain-containing protein n=1 Tax=Aspergillus wentii DTO 134E9 TaxID=1073089 RepID=A0A1L9RRF0_ASPWE|nr:uncharacterized protein ASPWEDRAFT_738670 [Aspergillus wentii DTO 134E9]OJJ37494.1 hypothetical protein ASPWEDRAFT_738670 [Aspergillus wentii DTO 134E9]
MKVPLTFQLLCKTAPPRESFATYRRSYHTGPATSGQPIIHSVFEKKTETWQYVVADPSTSSAVVIDPVLDFDPVTRAITSESADSLLSLVKQHRYQVDRILETHIHADHLTAASYIQNALAKQQTQRPALCIGKRIGQVQDLFGQRYSVAVHEYRGVFDHLFDDDEMFDIGDLRAQAIHLPGHTPDHLGYKIGDNVFCGDSLFHADIGTARCDFPGGSAESLYRSGRKLLALPDHVKIWTGHDYPPPGRSEPISCISVKEHRKRNKHLMDGVTEAEFMAVRHERDAKLGEPKLLHQSLQMNIRAGHLPEPSITGQRMLHLPLRLNCPGW